jgi:hypothetical protein
MRTSQMELQGKNWELSQCRGSQCISQNQDTITSFHLPSQETHTSLSAESLLGFYNVNMNHWHLNELSLALFYSLEVWQRLLGPNS